MTPSFFIFPTRRHTGSLHLSNILIHFYCTLKNKQRKISYNFTCSLGNREVNNAFEIGISFKETNNLPPESGQVQLVFFVLSALNTLKKRGKMHQKNPFPNTLSMQKVATAYVKRFIFRNIIFLFNYSCPVEF